MGGHYLISKDFEGPNKEDDEVRDEIKAKRAKLEAWKKEREAKKALDEAKAKAMALAGKSAPPGESLLYLPELYVVSSLDRLQQRLLRLNLLDSSTAQPSVDSA